MAQQIVSTMEVSTIAPAIQPLDQLYIFRKPSAVSEFLEIYPFLGPLLREAHSQIWEYFGPYPNVTLEVVADPEVHGLVKIFGYIVTQLAPAEAGKRLQQFDRKWFLPRISRTKGLLNFDVEFR